MPKHWIIYGARSESIDRNCNSVRLEVCIKAIGNKVEWQKHDLNCIPGECKRKPLSGMPMAIHSLACHQSLNRFELLLFKRKVIGFVRNLTAVQSRRVQLCNVVDVELELLAMDSRWTGQAIGCHWHLTHDNNSNNANIYIVWSAVAAAGHLPLDTGLT